MNRRNLFRVVATLSLLNSVCVGSAFASTGNNVNGIGYSKVELYEQSDEFNEDQIEQLKLGVKNGVDVSKFADPELSWGVMEEIRRSLSQGWDITPYVKPEYTVELVEEISGSVALGVDLSCLDYEDWSQTKKRFYLRILNLGVDPGVLSGKQLSENQLITIAQIEQTRNLKAYPGCVERIERSVYLQTLSYVKEEYSYTQMYRYACMEMREE